MLFFFYYINHFLGSNFAITCSVGDAASGTGQITLGLEWSESKIISKICRHQICYNFVFSTSLVITC